MKIKARLSMRLSDVVPPILIRAILRSTRSHGLWGDFPDWSSALAASAPYETDIGVYHQIVDRIRKANVKSGRNLLPTLSALALLHGSARLLDFGGNLGMVFFETERLVGDRIEHWRIVDLAPVVEYANRNVHHAKLTFSASLGESIAEIKPNFILSAHTLQYLERPYDTLKVLFSSSAEVVVLHELPLGSTDRIIVQTLPAALGGSSRPARILSEIRVAESAAAYDLVEEIELPLWDPLINARKVARVYRLPRERASSGSL